MFSEWINDIVSDFTLSEKHAHLLQELVKDLKRDIIVFGSFGRSEPQRRVFIDSFLKFTTLCFADQGARVGIDENFNGSLGSGSLDYVSWDLSRKSALVITKAKDDAIREGVGQAIAQLTAVCEVILLLCYP